jgi:hypothetical protein
MNICNHSNICSNELCNHRTPHKPDSNYNCVKSWCNFHNTLVECVWTHENETADKMQKELDNLDNVLESAIKKSLDTQNEVYELQKKRKIIEDALNSYVLYSKSIR